MVTKEEYLARRASGSSSSCHLPYTAEDAAFMRKLCEDFQGRNCSLIEIAFTDGLDPADFRVYVDRNIIALGTLDSQLAIPGSVLGRVEPGEHRIIVRDRDPRQPGRRESNLVTAEVAPHQRLQLLARLDEGALQLVLLGTEDFPPGTGLTESETGEEQGGE